ncbi:MAG: hypothetical protein WAW17_07150 [Rhodococcus sp. (in: high G+C Gram-positive bacteria)]|uniref:hypothetical protein n=1 Tax=Rhodococcus sp. TaxID=1831 RepID=UPI003BB0ED03
MRSRADTIFLTAAQAGHALILAVVLWYPPFSWISAVFDDVLTAVLSHVLGVGATDIASATVTVAGIALIIHAAFAALITVAGPHPQYQEPHRQEIA